MFKKHPGPLPAIFRRSLSEQDGDSTKVRASLKDYHWCYHAKSKRVYDKASLDLGNLLGTYRWQTPSRLHWRLTKRTDALKTEQPLKAHNIIADGHQEDPEEKAVMPATRPFRAPFCRSISEPAAHWKERSTKLEGGEQENYFIRGFFSTLSGSFSKVLNRKGEQSAAAMNEEVENDHMDLTAGILVQMF